MRPEVILTRLAAAILLAAVATAALSWLFG